MGFVPKVVVLAQAVVQAAAFSGAPRASQQTETPATSAIHAVRPSLTASSLWTHAEEQETSAFPVGAGTVLAGAVLAAAAALRLSSSRSSPVRGQREAVIARGKVSPSGWKFQPIEGRIAQGVEGAPPRGPSYRPWITLRHLAKRGQRYHRQQKILKESNIQSANGGWHKWYPHRAVFNLYQGPDSHPDNPWFPAASPGYDKTEMGPPRNGLQTRSPYLVSDSIADDAPTTTEAFSSSSFSAPVRAASSFAGANAPVFGASARSKTTISSRRATRSFRTGVIMHAHKKAASSTKNQGNKQNAQFYGLTAKGYMGSAVRAGQMLARQKGFKWYAGANVVVGKDFTLHALKDGIVQWRGNWQHKEVVVVPWQYVRERCEWINPNRLGPQKYEPWMGQLNHHKRNHIMKKRTEWLEADEGKEWAAKHDAKNAKQKEIQLKIRAIRKTKRAGVRGESKKESVAASSDTES